MLGELGKLVGGMAVLHGATGFTGALTLVFVLRLLARLWRQPPAVEVYFAPKGGCTEAVVREIGRARREVLVQAYSFGSRPIAEALVAAKTRGVEVVVLLDPINEEATSELPYLVEQGIAPLIDTRHAFAHNHIVVIDRRTVLTGSFTFTSQADTDNAANLLVMRYHGELAGRYAAQFAEHRSHAQPAKSKGDGPATLPLPSSAARAA
jgi:phosphatidylserine/phosphatidylglycerophosphate/cardiolipin synthase-like enzyme